MKLVKGVCSL